MTNNPASSTPNPALLLNDGRTMPQLGLGVMRYGGEDQTKDVVQRAFDLGYRLFDTAAAYGTEQQTGEALCGLDAARDQYFVTTKLWNDSHGTDAPRAAFEKSLDRLSVEYIDLYLIHWPLPMFDRYLETWQALIALRDEGRAKSIGVSTSPKSKSRACWRKQASPLP